MGFHTGIPWGFRRDSEGFRMGLQGFHGIPRGRNYEFSYIWGVRNFPYYNIRSENARNTWVRVPVSGPFILCLQGSVSAPFICCSRILLQKPGVCSWSCSRSCSCSCSCPCPCSCSCPCPCSCSCCCSCSCSPATK